jgi:hypothetical protein
MEQLSATKTLIHGRLRAACVMDGEVGCIRVRALCHILLLNDENGS